MNAENRDSIVKSLAATYGLELADPVTPGGLYQPIIVEGGHLYLSGQIPKVGDTVLYEGKVGKDVSVDDAVIAAAICALRLLGLIQQAKGSLHSISRILRMTVFIQGSSDFSQYSLIADGASRIMKEVLGDGAGHARTAVGVMGLPRNAAVEVDLLVATTE